MEVRDPSTTSIVNDVRTICAQIERREAHISAREAELERRFQERFASATADLRKVCAQLRLELADVKVSAEALAKDKELMERQRDEALEKLRQTTDSLKRARSEIDTFKAVLPPVV